MLCKCFFVSRFRFYISLFSRSGSLLRELNYIHSPILSLGRAIVQSVTGASNLSFWTYFFRLDRETMCLVGLWGWEAQTLGHWKWCDVATNPGFLSWGFVEITLLQPVLRVSHSQHSECYDKFDPLGCLRLSGCCGFRRKGKWILVLSAYFPSCRG